jgi:tripartite-type tricarboxylate transporter receptor subunit TctC
MIRVLRRAWGLIGLCALGCLPAAFAAEYPERPIRLIVPFPPGGAVDMVGRNLAPRLAELLGQQVIVDNRGGASGTIGTAEAVRAPADGYTLLLVFDSHAANQHLYKGLRYDTFKSFDYISLLVAAANEFPANSLADLIKLAKSKPQGVRYGSSGFGGSNHLYALLLSSMAGIDTVHVPYKGGGPMLTDLVAGQIDFVVSSLPIILGYVKGGRVKPLAIGAPKRVPQLPEVPIVADTVRGYEAYSWVGLLAPAGTPKPILQKIQTAVHQVMTAPPLVARLERDGFIVLASTPEEFLRRVRADSERVGKLIRDHNVQIE